MKVILNEDVKHLGEEGDVKNVANGYARNFLFPRNIAVPYNDVTVAYFEGKKEEIESRKEAKRKDSASLKEKLSAHSLTLSMPAGANGKLYGAVTSQTISEALAKDGFDIERKRIEVPGLTIKSVGKYTVKIRLYEATVAELIVHVEGQDQQKSENKASAKAEKEVKTEESVVTEEAATETSEEN